MTRTEYDSLFDSLSSSKRKALAPEVGRLRAIKSKYEQEVMRQAANLSARAHNKVCGLVDVIEVTSNNLLIDHALHRARNVRTHRGSTF